ncbi:alpha/beta hydrolase [Cuniculiplasma sp. SKW4]|uniref:alpha/beta hydrolase n=1 Tax=Cuniculiplasma sp. SKW4 TaxID=3400171 RepID=UPI003FCFC403
MAIDPSLQGAIELSKMIEPWKFSEEKVPELRNILENSYRENSREEVKRVRDLKISYADAILDARLYEPENAGKGTIVYFHGGGFVFDSIQSHDNVCRIVANSSKSNVISIAYRLAPEHRFPKAVHDAVNSFLWIYEHSEELDIDKNRIALMGDSSGGNLCGAASLMLRDQGKVLPKMQVLIYPFVGLDQSSFSMREYTKGYRLDREMLLWIANMYLNSKEDFVSPYFSIFAADNFKGIEETIIATGEYDPLRDMGESLADRMIKEGVSVTSFRCLGMIHGFVNFTGTSKTAKNFLEMIGFLTGKRLEE